MTDTAGSHAYAYDAANRLTSADGVAYTWDDRGNLVGDGTFTYAYNAAGRLVRAESVTATLVYTYNHGGLRVAQAVGGNATFGGATTFAWDWATGVPEMLSDGGNLYLVGHETLGQWDGDDWSYHLPDALGSVRQAADGTGAVTAARAWTPYGVELGGAQAGLGYAGEWWDEGLEMQYLRARWYAPEAGRFTQRDLWEGSLQRPMSHNAWLYVYANPTHFVDPSGHYALDETEKRHLRRLQQAYLDSAGRHNQIPTMDDNGFAALIAATIIDENQVSPLSDMDRRLQRREYALIDLGCIVSGHILKRVCQDEPDPKLCLTYLLNELPEGHPLEILASVGIGNIKLYTAANLWQGRTCRVVWNETKGDCIEECVEVDAGPLQQTRRLFGLEWVIDIPNPFEEICENGICESYDPSEVTAAYRAIGAQLRNDKKNIEYAAAILEQGALRALSVDLTPSAFNSVTWYKRGVQTDQEIENSRWDAGSAIYVLQNVSKVLGVWGLSTTWNSAMEVQYEKWHEYCKQDPYCQSGLD